MAQPFCQCYIPTPCFSPMVATLKRAADTAQESSRVEASFTPLLGRSDSPHMGDRTVNRA
eukprot:6027046-Pleurochrysis_carterae.AAC.3